MYSVMGGYYQSTFYFRRHAPAKRTPPLIILGFFEPLAGPVVFSIQNEPKRVGKDPMGSSSVLRDVQV